jgi:HSP20 family protein
MKEKKGKELTKVDQNTKHLSADRQDPVYLPATDIYEREDRIILRCDVPGVKMEQIDIQLNQTELEIVAKQDLSIPEGLDQLSGEYSFGVFRRKFTLPQLIDREKITAQLHHGVLSIELPKAEQAKPRKIEISK